SNDIQTAFLVYANSIEVKIYNDLAFRAVNLKFLPAEATLHNIKKLSKFAFIRVIRQMPTLRNLPLSVRMPSGLVKCPLPQDPPIAQDIRVAIMDGGLPPMHTIKPWLTSNIPMDETAEDDPEYNKHGLGVTSAFLFGPLREGHMPERPFSPITHLRILDKKSEKDDPLLLYRTLGFIEEVLLSREYQFLNLSLGPDLPIENQDVHAWTAVIDDLLSDGNVFLTIAAGNNGELDRASGNARIQIPSDCVNGVTVGASDSQSIKWGRASYSAIGPGRSPGFIKPDLMAFGGTSSDYFHVLAPGTTSTISPTLGTSFASPLLLRMAVGIRAFLGDTLSILAIKALLIHTASRGNNDPVEVGWGKAEEDLDAIISCPGSMARVIYQGELKPGKVLRAPVPLPKDITNGFITLRATFCYSSIIDPQNPDTYTRSGLDVCFRPNETRIASEAKFSKTKPFFNRQPYATEAVLRTDFVNWETVLHSEKRFQASTLNSPSFDIHYQIRENGMAARSLVRLRYALVVSIIAPHYNDINARILSSFPQLQTIQPRIALPLQAK
ncbi:MAG: S8 family peptidase, partial [Mobilitalea sp.]